MPPSSLQSLSVKRCSTAQSSCGERAPFGCAHSCVSASAPRFLFADDFTNYDSRLQIRGPLAPSNRESLSSISSEREWSSLDPEDSQYSEAAQRSRESQRCVLLESTTVGTPSANRRVSPMIRPPSAVNFFFGENIRVSAKLHQSNARDVRRSDASFGARMSTAQVAFSCPRSRRRTTSTSASKLSLTTTTAPIRRFLKLTRSNSASRCSDSQHLPTSKKSRKSTVFRDFQIPTLINYAGAADVFQGRQLQRRDREPHRSHSLRGKIVLIGS